MSRKDAVSLKMVGGIWYAWAVTAPSGVLQDHQQRHLLPINGSALSSTSYGFIRECFTKENPLVLLVWNETAGHYQEIQDLNSSAIPNSSRLNHSSRVRRLLAHQPYQGLVMPAISTNRRLETEVYGYLCDCVGKKAAASEYFYCPTIAPFCLVDLDRPSKPGLEVSCFGETHTFYVRYIFPLAVFLLIVWFVLCFCSPKGYAARMYARKRFCRRNDAQYARAVRDELDRMFERVLQRQRAAELIHQQYGGRRVYIPGSAPSAGLLFELAVRRQQRLEQDPVLSDGEPPWSGQIQSGTAEASSQAALAESVVLKTCKYDGGVSADSGSDMGVGRHTHNNTCSICLIDLVAGDRVGDLPCGHFFHTACLKSWIQRRNDLCPLCKATNLTTLPDDTQADGNRAA